MAQLFDIITLARAGAGAEAWRVFRERGYHVVNDDPAVLSVHGRLLKDDARGLAGAAQEEAYRAAAAAYASAAALDGTTYPLINAATLSFLAGDTDLAHDRAGQVLDRLDVASPDAETPYYTGATRAEALLLLGQHSAARAVLTDAVALAPGAYEDHASTLRQFASILAITRDDDAWLDALRPPRVLHFAGHMALDFSSGILTSEVAAVLARERIGAGYGALAAGADIVVAEALVAAGAELHVVLPGSLTTFTEVSVAPAGGDWVSRFAKVLGAATSVHVIAHIGDDIDDISIGLAGELAMGRAAFAARTLATEAIQLIIASANDDALGATMRDADIWLSAGRRQHRLIAPRSAVAAPSLPLAAPSVVVAAALWLRGTGSMPLAACLAEIAATLARLPQTLIPPAVQNGGLLLIYADAVEALAASEAIHAAHDGIAVGGDIGLCRRFPNPFGGELLDGFCVGIAMHIASVASPGATYVSEDLVAGLHVHGVPLARAEHVGDIDCGGRQPVRLFALQSMPINHTISS